MDPRNTDQVDRDLILMKPIPDVGSVDKKVLSPGKLAGSVQRVGKK
jgi:hypothetical protein